MAEADKATTEKSDATEAAPDASFIKGFFRLLRRHVHPRWFVTRQGIATLLLISVAMHVVGFWYSSSQAKKGQAEMEYEIELGAFSFVPQEPDPEVVSAEFSIFVTFLDEFSMPGRLGLETHRHRVKQNIEQLLRQARGKDFSDPSLNEIKRILQETINKTIGLRAIQDVIITDFSIQRSEVTETVTKEEPAVPTNSAVNGPW
jgi:flagellar basal body-associated protein FliL